MYCPDCGAESTQGLNYCKRCGAGLSGPNAPIEAKSSFGKMFGLILPVALVCIGGFIALFSTVYNLGERTGFDTRALIAIMGFGGATVVCVVGLLVWLLLRLAGYEPTPHYGKGERSLQRDYTAQQLPPSPTSMPSVTENTTRNFDPGRYSSIQPNAENRYREKNE
ncbi:MAG TPA: hypothetical protein VKN18_14055 [Blastocatellia bacterium]|nr:hypothetical protein [Blastocatellia bacterium]